MSHMDADLKLRMFLDSLPKPQPTGEPLPQHGAVAETRDPWAFLKRIVSALAFFSHAPKAVRVRVVR